MLIDESCATSSEMRTNTSKLHTKWKECMSDVRSLSQSTYWVKITGFLFWVFHKGCVELIPCWLMHSNNYTNVDGTVLIICIGVAWLENSLHSMQKKIRWFIELKLSVKFSADFQLVFNYFVCTRNRVISIHFAK